jgi:hypothetical protein
MPPNVAETVGGGDLADEHLLWTRDLPNPGFFISTLPRPEHRGSYLSSRETGSKQAGFSLRISALFFKRGSHRGFPEHFPQKPPKQAGPALMKMGDPGLLRARMDRTGGAGLQHCADPR